MADFVSGVGPLFGPDFVVVTVNDATGTQYGVQVYPDAHNPELRAAGLPTQYYFQPAQVYLAHKQTSPQDFDFEMTLFKGLGSEEANITPTELQGASTEMGGGFCTFSTTFAIPPSVIAAVIVKLQNREHEAPVPRLAAYFNQQPGDPAPGLGIVPITNSSVICAVQDPSVTDGKILMTAQYSQKGSIEQQGICTFLISCNLFAAGEIAAALKAGASPPFTVTNVLKESFYVNAVTAQVDVDIDKVYDSFSAAVDASSFLGIDDLSASEAWSSCITNGGVTTSITENGSVLDASTAKWVNDNVDEMKKTAMDMVKTEIFDWDPAKADSKATTSGRGWFSEFFGGAAVSLKSDHERKGVHIHQELDLNETITVEQGVSGDLNDLLPAVRADLNKYLFVIDIGEFFKKVQVVGKCLVDFGDKLPDGTDLSDPLLAVQLEAGYPDFDNPVVNGQANLQMLAQGEHYLEGQTAPDGPVSPAIWKAGNAGDYVNFSFLRLDNPVDAWPQDQVKLRRQLVFNGNDPRVNLSPKIAPNDRAIAEIEVIGTDHSPIITASDVGYVFVRFDVRPPMLPPNIVVTITPTIGQDTYAAIVITPGTEKNAIWEIYSDKYFAESTITYTMTVEVDGPEFTDEPVIYSTPAPVTWPIGAGPLKQATVVAPLPGAPADKVALVNQYIAAARAGSQG
jgi:hypothetical protein